MILVNLKTIKCLSITKKYKNMETNTQHYYSQGNHNFENVSLSEELEKSKQQDSDTYFQNNKVFENNNNSNLENNHYPTERRRSFTSVFDL